MLHESLDPVIPLLLAGLLLVAVVAMLRLPADTAPTRRTELLIHRCDFCKEAILAIDDEAKCFVRHAGHRALLGYSVVNACGACVREHRIDGAYFPEGADPSS